MDNTEEFDHLLPIDVQSSKHRDDPNLIAQTVLSAQTQIENLNENLNAVIWQDSKLIHTQVEDVIALSAADTNVDLKLLGVPILVKELDSSISGTPNSWGNLQLKQEGYCDTFTSTSVTKLKNAGAIIMGKTNNPELGLTVTTKSKAHGPCNNPSDVTRNSGGSSGGSAASVASSMTSVALGSDGGGSIRIPASLCGVFGFKPSRGVIPLGPMIEEAWAGLVCKGLLASNLTDLTAVLNTICESEFKFDINPNFGDKLEDLKIGIRSEGFAHLYPINPLIREALDYLVNYLSALGCQVSVSSPQAYENESIIKTFLDIIAYNTFQDLEFTRGRMKQPFKLDQCDNETQYFYERGRQIDEDWYLQTKDQLNPFSQNISDWHNKFDLLITPTTGDVAPAHGEVELNPDESPFIYGGLCFPSNIAGAPALSIPIKNGNKSALPIGLQIIGKRGSDNLVLNLGEFLNSNYSDIFVTQIRDITS
ncbi:MAG TPA: amidase [Acidimicrobiia bacterium]|nr:amidase [Acidimicrobiia bacterium]